MKTYKFLSIPMVLAAFIGCSPEEEIQTPNLTSYVFYEDFLRNTQDGEDVDLQGWTNYAQTGVVKWKQGIYSGAKYAEFTSYKSGQASNIGWLISPPINMDNSDNEKLAFDVAQAYVSAAANSIELFISTDYDGFNVKAATWIPKTFSKPPLDYESNFDFFSSGLIDLSAYTGNIYIAFKVTGSGTNTSLDGTYEIDNIRIFNK